MNREGIGGRPTLDATQSWRVVTAMRDLKRSRYKDNGSELARALELSPSAISQIFSGKTTPSYPTALAVAALLGVSIDSLLNGMPEGKLPNRAQAARIARDGGVPPAAVDEVLAEDHPQDRPVLWWIDRMRARATLLVASESGEVRQGAPPELPPPTRRVPKAG